jgi:parallel beta-helix repeat protein
VLISASNGEQGAGMGLNGGRGRRAILGVAVVLPFTALVGSAPAYAVVPPCDSPINVDTVLTADLTCPGDGLIITASGITLDLGGHTITGPGPDVRPSPTQIYAGVRVLSGRSNVTVKNGTIQRFTVGITTQQNANANELTGLRLFNNGQGVLTQISQGNVPPGSDNNYIHDNTVQASTGTAVGLNGTGNRFESNTVADNRFGVVVPGSNTSVRNNRLANNDSTGVNLNGNNNVVVGNSIDQNTGNAVNIGGPSTTAVLQGNRIESNQIALNGDPGSSFGAINVFSSNGAVVSGNQVVGISRAIGASVAPNSVGTTISGNLFNRFVDGIFVNNGATNTRIIGNQAHQNTDDGIDVRSTSTTITANTTNFNGDWGIVAPPGVTDGGGNHAFGNGHAGQCTGVVCT